MYNGLIQMTWERDVTGRVDGTVEIIKSRKSDKLPTHPRTHTYTHTHAHAHFLRSCYVHQTALAADWNTPLHNRKYPITRGSEFNF